MPIHSLVSLLLLISLTGCGGFRGGIESVPFAEGTEPPETEAPHDVPHEITLPDLMLHLSLNNTLRTYQYEVMLFIIPTYLNFQDEFKHRDAESLELSLQVTARDSVTTIDPRKIILLVDDQPFHPTAVWVNNPERERQVINAFVEARREASPKQSPLVPRASQWRDAITAPVPVRPGEKSERFIVTFPIPPPSPERSLSLDLNPALGELSGIPRIQFKSKRWSDTYS